MRVWFLCVLIAVLCVHCGDSDSDGVGGSAQSGGDAASGGVSSTGDASQTGGTTGTGDMISTGGSTAVVGHIDALPDGQVIAPWDSLCVATFTEDFDIVDTFGDVELSVKAGQRYLLGEPSFFGTSTIYYIGSEGPVDLEIDVSDATMPPFTSSCDGGTTTSLSAVFVETTVYADEDLTMPLCTLSASTTMAGDGVDYAFAGGDLFSSSTYWVDLGALSSSCDGNSEGYIKAGEVEIGSTSYTVIPVATVLGPA